MSDGFSALTVREKQTLRLIVRGHDAKSAARELGLSVHTINERLRDARRKLGASSSREAGRRLLAHEDATLENAGDEPIGAVVPASFREERSSDGQRGGRARSIRFAAGAAVMSIAVALADLIAVPRSPVAIPVSATDASVEAAARHWLALLDQGRWAQSWAATGSAFRALNTVERWAAASQQVRAPLGVMRSRTFLNHDDLPAPPHGYDVVRFRTAFANRRDAVETVTLERDGDAWRVVGVAVL